MDGYKLEGDLGVLTVTKYHGKDRSAGPTGIPVTNLYVKNFPTPDFTEDDLKVLIKICCNLIKIELVCQVWRDN